MKQTTTKIETKKTTKTIDRRDRVKLTSNAGEVPDPPEGLVLRIESLKNPTIVKVIEEIEKYFDEEERKQDVVMLTPDPCRLLTI